MINKDMQKYKKHLILFVSMILLVLTACKNGTNESVSKHSNEIAQAIELGSLQVALAIVFLGIIHAVAST